MLRKIIITCTAMMLAAAIAMPAAYAKKDFAHKIAPELYGITDANNITPAYSWIDESINLKESGIEEQEVMILAKKVRASVKKQSNIKKNVKGK